MKTLNKYKLCKYLDYSGRVLSDTDFPRVFLLMHKWFVESQSLANMLYDMYVKSDDENNNASISVNNESSETSNNSNTVSKHSANQLQQKICHAFRY